MAKRPGKAVFHDDADKLEEQTLPYKIESRELDLVEATQLRDGTASGFSNPKYPDENIEVRYQNNVGYDGGAYYNQNQEGLNSADVVWESSKDDTSYKPQTYQSSRADAYFSEWYVDCYFMNWELYQNKTSTYSLTGDEVVQSHTGTSNTYQYTQDAWSCVEKENSFSENYVKFSGTRYTVDHSYSTSSKDLSLDASHSGVDVGSKNAGVSVSTTNQGMVSSTTVGGIDTSVSAKLATGSFDFKALGVATSQTLFQASYSSGYRYAHANEFDYLSKNQTTKASGTYKVAAAKGICLFSSEHTAPGLPNYRTLSLLSGAIVLSSHISNTVGLASSVLENLSSDSAEKFDDQELPASIVSIVEGVLGGAAGAASGLVGIQQATAAKVRDSQPIPFARGGGLRLTPTASIMSFGRVGAMGWEDFSGENAGLGIDDKGIIVDDDSIVIKFSHNCWLRLSKDGVEVSGPVRFTNRIHSPETSFLIPGQVIKTPVSTGLNYTCINEGEISTGSLYSKEATAMDIIANNVRILTESASDISVTDDLNNNLSVRAPT